MAAPRQAGHPPPRNSGQLAHFVEELAALLRAAPPRDQVVGSRLWILVVLIGLSALLPAVGWAQDDEHPQTRRDERSTLGPLCSDATADGFALNVGTRDSQPHPARLLVYDAQTRPRPADPPLVTLDSPTAVWHLLRVRGLLPSRRYRYHLELEGHPDANG